MEVTIGNEIIADALGYHRTNIGWDNGSEVVSSLSYDSDWNDLMHVVDWCFKQKADYQDHKDIEDALINADSTDRKHNVWIACIHFIQHKYKKK